MRLSIVRKATIIISQNTLWQIEGLDLCKWILICRWLLALGGFFRSSLYFWSVVHLEVFFVLNEVQIDLRTVVILALPSPICLALEVLQDIIFLQRSRIVIIHSTHYNVLC